MNKFKFNVPLKPSVIKLFILIVGVLIVFAVAKLIPLIWSLPETRIRDFQSTLPQDERLSAREELEAINQYRNTLISNLIGGIGTVATISAGIVLYLNFNVANKQAKIANRNAELAEDRLISERFSKAVEQLGSEKIQVRMGGIFSLEKIAYDSPDENYWTVMEVLSAFIRNSCPIAHQGGSETTGEANDNATQRSVDADKDIATDVQAALTVIGRCNPVNQNGDHLLDIRREKIEKLDLSSTKLIGAYLRDADLSNINFYRSDLSESCLHETNLVKSNLYAARLIKADLFGANFRNSILSEAILSDAKNIGTAIDLNMAETEGTIWPSGFHLAEN